MQIITRLWEARDLADLLFFGAESKAKLLMMRNGCLGIKVRVCCDFVKDEYYVRWYF